ncbi:FHA domain-containing protein [Helicobacter trogontum]|uniref:FHA domain-containing protein n=1 Tax=Helicobacter trogontum TaxID=50960 RepID=UPI000CF0C510|nr:FHA domain-containing protein [Helicobacter trogontum]
MQKIAITAQHIHDLSTTSLYCVIDENGGTIGSDSGNNLCLQDQQINSQHVHIQYEEGFFTITSIADSDIFYNNSFSKLLAGYETTIELGDTFRIGNYQCSIIDPKDLNEEILNTKNIIKEVATYDKLDTLQIRPRGQVDGMNIHEASIENILHENEILDDLTNITPNTFDTIQQTLSSSNQRVFMQDDVISKQKNSQLDTANNHAILHNQFATKEANIENNQPLNKQTILTFLDNALKNLFIDAKIPLHTNVHLTMQDIQDILQDIPLIDSPLLINTLVLGIIFKELHTPLFEVLDNDIFESTLSYAIQEQRQGDEKTLQYLLIQALHSYLKKEG